MALVVEIVIVVISLFIVYPATVLAAFSMSLSELTNKDVLSNEQEVLVNASMSGLPSESYFRIAWQKSSGDSYFGYMKNNSGDWVRIQPSQDCKNYFKITDLTTSALGFVAKIGDDNVIENGSYTLKLRRYTASCSSYSDSNTVAVQINLPTPSPSPSPDPTASPKPQTPTPDPTRTPTPTPTKSPTPKPTVSPTIRPTESPIPTEITTPFSDPTPQVLGIASESSPKPVSTMKIAAGFIASGISFIGISAYLAWRKTKI